MNVVIVASHDIVLTRDIASKIASFIVILQSENEREMAMWGSPNSISIRAPMGGGASSPVEQMAMKLSAEVGLTFQFFRPYAKDRASNFDRDFLLVEQADRVMAFFHQNRLMEGGTGHVVQAALMRGVPVEAWTHEASGNLVSVGSDDGFEVGQEGAGWMQLRYLEWQATEVEAQLRGVWTKEFTVGGLSLSTATPTDLFSSSISSIGRSTPQS